MKIWSINDLNTSVRYPKSKVLIPQLTALWSLPLIKKIPYKYNATFLTTFHVIKAEKGLNTPKSKINEGDGI